MLKQQNTSKVLNGYWLKLEINDERYESVIQYLLNILFYYNKKANVILSKLLPVMSI